MFIYSIEHVISIFSFLIIVVMENQQVHHQRPGFIQMHKLFMIMFVHVLILIKIKSFYLVVHLAVLLHCTLVKTKSIINIRILLCFFFVKLLILLRQIQHHHYIVLFLKILSHQFLIWLKDYFKFLYLIMCRFGAIKMWYNLEEDMIFFEYILDF
jgi:hypothetical protein